MPYTPTDLEAYVRQRAPEIARDIRESARKAKVEADLVAEVERILERFAKNFDVTLHLERERSLVNGRADAVYNRFVIEYEPAGSLERSNSYRANKHAIEQVQNYMQGLERLDRHRKERLAGVALDGTYYIFVRYRDDKWSIDDPLVVDTHSTETFLRYLLSLATELALTPGNLLRDFGENSNVARQVVPALYDALKATDNPKVQTLFRQWQRQFREVSGYEATSGQLEGSDLARVYAVRDRSPDLEQLFFSIHTYYATFIKLLALQVAHYYLMPKVGTGLGTVANFASDKLARYLVEMERGGLFAQLGIRNFLEGDFFGWFLEIWNNNLDAALRRLISELANYSLVTLDVDPEETRDLLKQLYQNLVPRNLRHALGEYYTPDWLAERLLNQVGYDGDPKKRLLDPACGSGTFLVLAIKRVRHYADEKMLPSVKVLDQITANIVGFDLNPLAVISSRTNYLLALGDLLSHRKGEISIPVYLADSILTPAMETSEAGQLTFLDRSSESKVGSPGFAFNTAVGRFTVPRSLVDACYIDDLANLLEESVQNQLRPTEFKTRFLERFPLDPIRDDAEIGIAVTLYEQLHDLDQEGINGIWARIIKNAFAPLFQGHFDYVVGNPPWVNWESLPSEYRTDTAKLWHLYRLLPDDRANARQRSAQSKTDISTLMLIIGIDQYLVDNGKLGFVITQTIFKTERGARGFRQYLVKGATPIEIEHVDDLARIQVFEGATNRTSVLIARKGRRTKFPVSYTRWRKEIGGASIRTTLTLSEVFQFVRLTQWIAQPIDPEDLSSPWMTCSKRVLKAVTKILGTSAYYDSAREGANTRGANGIFWVQKIVDNPDGSFVIANMPEAGRANLMTIQSQVEDDLVYPLLRGQEVTRWSARPINWIIVPHNPAKPSIPIEESELKLKYPKTYRFLFEFYDALRKRKQFRNFDPSVGEFYGLYNVGPYSFSTYKVVWREQSAQLTCAVVAEKDGKQVIPDHKLMMLPLTHRAEADFVCACMNSSPASLVVKLYSIEIEISTHVLRYVRIPLYDSAKPLHRELAELSSQAHLATLQENREHTQSIEREIDQLVAKLWGLTQEELKEIQQSLAELE